LNYLGLGTVEESDPWVNMDSGYDVFALDYRLFFPLSAQNSLNLYLEGLAGAVSSNVELDAGDWELSAEDWGFGWGVGGGLQWNATSNFGLSLGYTFLGLDEPEDEGIAIGEDSLHLVRLNALFRF
jgi:opacity protein-like surface antigen